MSRLIGIGSNRQNALEDLEIAKKMSLKVAGVNKLSSGVMKVGVSVVVVMLGWNLDNILLIFSIKFFEKVDASVLEHEKVGRMEGLFRDKRKSRPAHSFFDYFYLLKQNFCKTVF